MSVASANLLFATPSDASGVENYWSAVRTFMNSLPRFVGEGMQVTFTVALGAFIMSPAPRVSLTKPSLDTFFQPIITQLSDYGITYRYSSHQFEPFLESYEVRYRPIANVSDSILHGRLLPRFIVEDNIDQYMDAVRCIVDTNYFFIGLVLDVSQTPALKVAANSYWRKTLIASVLRGFLRLRELHGKSSESTVYDEHDAS